MRIAKIIGTVTLSRCHPDLTGATLKLAAPLSLADLTSDMPAGSEADSLVVYDQWGAGMDSKILLSESREAAQPFHPHTKPIDAYNAAILDQLHIADNQPAPTPPDKDNRQDNQ